MGYSHGRKWTEEEIERAILNIVSTLGISHFPTHSDMINFYGNTSLTNRVSKSGGTRFWANKTGLPIKQCESEVGNDYELYAIQEIADHTGLIAVQTKPRYPYDLLVDNSIKVDVKVSYPFKNNCGAFANTFNLEKKEPTCDIFVMYCLDLNGNIQKNLIIPSCILSGQTQVGVGTNSKWDCYNDKWEYFIKYDLFINNIMKCGVVY